MIAGLVTKMSSRPADQPGKRVQRAHATGIRLGEKPAAISPLGIPVAMAPGILKHHQFDVDVVINRARGYGAVTALLACGLRRRAADLTATHRAGFVLGNGDLTLAIVA
jgi:hypothetical protein